MEITRGVIGGAKKVLVYGPEGIGKSTFAAAFPDPLFIDTEGSTKEMDVARLPVPSSWTMIKEEARYVAQHQDTCRTLVIDTADWAEKMAIQSVLDEHNKNGIEDFGYGNGYRYVYEKFGELLNILNDVVEAGVNVVLTAHAALRKFEQPDELGAYDRYTMKLIDSPKTSISAAVKEWADMVLFANYKTIVVTDSKTKKTKAQGGQRVMYTTHHTCWDAKNRYNLPDELPFRYDEIRSVIEGGAAKTQQRTGKSSESAEKSSEKGEKERNIEKAETAAAKTQRGAAEKQRDKPAPFPDPDTAAAGSDKAAAPDLRDQPVAPVPALDPPEPEAKKTEEPDKRIPKALRDLMIKDGVTEWDIENFVTLKGWAPFDTRIWEYETMRPGLIDGGLVAQWTKVRDMIRQVNKDQVIPY